MSKFVVEKFQEEAYHLATCCAPEGEEEEYMHQYAKLTEPFDSLQEAVTALSFWGDVNILEQIVYTKEKNATTSQVQIHMLIGKEEHPAQIRKLSDTMSRLCNDRNFTLLIGVENGAFFLDDKKQSLIYTH